MTKEKKLRQMIEAERKKVAGYEQLAKLHSAYIAILLTRLGTSKDSGIEISDVEVSEALKKYEVRAFPAGEGKWSLYCEVIDK